MNKFDYKNLTPFKWFVLENFPFIEADFDSLTNWGLFCKLGKEINKIINSTNTLGIQVESLTDYVKNYFDNLDVQEEINNKLDEMVESGELEDLISNTFKLVKYTNTIEELKESNFSVGTYIKTGGYYSINDGGNGFYYIRGIKENEIADDMFTIELDNGNIAELIHDRTINFNTLGGKANDNTFNNSIVLKKVLNKIENLGYTINFGNGIYYFLTTISDVRLHTIKLKGFRTSLKYIGEGWFMTPQYSNYFEMDNFYVEGNGSNYGIDFGNETCYNSTFNRINYNNFIKSCYYARPAYVYLTNCTFAAIPNSQYCLEIGYEDEKLESELFYIDKCIFEGNLNGNGSFIIINQILDLHITNTDFCNILGKWIKINNKGDISGVIIDKCNFTRATEGIVFNFSGNQYVNNFVLNDCAFSINGKFEEGEDNIIKVEREYSNSGTIVNSHFTNLDVSCINYDNLPEFFFLDETNSSRIEMTFTRLPYIKNKFKIKGNNQAYTDVSVNTGNLIIANFFIKEFHNEIFMEGTFTTETTYNPYSTLISNMPVPLGIDFTPIACISFDGTVYPCTIDSSGNLKTRVQIPQNTILQLFGSYMKSLL